MVGIPIAVLVGVLAVAGAGLLFALHRSLRRGRRRGAEAAAGADARGRRSPAPVARGAVHVSEHVHLDPRMAFARPGMRGPLFQYGGDGPGVELDVPFAVVAVRTTGFAPDAGDRIVEVAVARVDASGHISDEYSTLVDPGRDVGPIFMHGINGSDVREAPTFEDIAGELLARMDGAVVVAHNAVVEERFLAAEFDRIGVQLPLNPALCARWLARQTLDASGDELTVPARPAGLPVTGGDGALTDVRTLARLLPQLLAGARGPLRFLTGARPMPELDGDAPPKLRIEDARGTSTWLAALIRTLPRAATEAREAGAQRYLDALTVALADGRIVGGESQALARLARTAGVGGAELVALHRTFLDAVGEVARRNPILTTAELRQLKTAASGLGLPEYFDDLRPTSPQTLIAARSMPAPRAGGDCRDCRAAGHYRATCPALAEAGR
jgi:DNA polymerase III epsilon subunit-like protein